MSWENLIDAGVNHTVNTIAKVQLVTCTVEPLSNIIIIETFCWSGGQFSMTLFIKLKLS